MHVQYHQAYSKEKEKKMGHHRIQNIKGISVYLL